MLVFLKEKTSLSNSHRRRNLIGYKNFSEGALPLVSCLFTISAVCLLLVLLAGKFKLLVVVTSWFDIDREEFEVVTAALFALLVVLDFLLFVVLLIGSASTSSWLTVVSLDVSFLFPFPVVVSSEDDDDLTGLEADEVAAVAECQLVSSWDTKCRRRSKYWL